MKTIKKLSIILGFAIPTITVITFANLMADGQKELYVAVAVVTYFMGWGFGEMTRVGIKSFKK